MLPRRVRHLERLGAVPPLLGRGLACRVDAAAWRPGARRTRVRHAQKRHGGQVLEEAAGRGLDSRPQPLQLVAQGGCSRDRAAAQHPGPGPRQGLPIQEAHVQRNGGNVHRTAAIHAASHAGGGCSSQQRNRCQLVAAAAAAAAESTTTVVNLRPAEHLNDHRIGRPCTE